MITGQAYLHLGLPSPASRPEQPPLFGDDDEA
jgi:hypothetical protein